MTARTWLDSGALHDLEYCDPALFRSRDEDEQKVCNFVLALALAFNDLRDLWWAQANQMTIPSVDQARSKHFGLQAGMRMRLLRLYYSNLHEVLKLIREHPKVLSHPLFQGTIRA